MLPQLAQYWANRSFRFAYCFPLSNSNVWQSDACFTAICLMGVSVIHRFIERISIFNEILLSHIVSLVPVQWTCSQIDIVISSLRQRIDGNWKVVVRIRTRSQFVHEFNSQFIIRWRRLICFYRRCATMRSFSLICLMTMWAFRCKWRKLSVISCTQVLWDVHESNENTRTPISSPVSHSRTDTPRSTTSTNNNKMRESFGNCFVFLLGQIIWDCHTHCVGNDDCAWGHEVATHTRHNHHHLIVLSFRFYLWLGDTEYSEWHIQFWFLFRDALFCLHSWGRVRVYVRCSPVYVDLFTQVTWSKYVHWNWNRMTLMSRMVFSFRVFLNDKAISSLR